jgi:hypothetical protein
MAIEGSGQRANVVTPEHLHAFRRSLDAIDRGGFFEVHGATIDDLIERSGDTYLWHTESGSAYEESSVLRARVDETGINTQARLAHGALGLMYALESAYLQTDAPIRGLTDVRYTAPVFEGARLRAHVEDAVDGISAFEVMSEDVEPALAITGRILYGALDEAYDAATFASAAEQQLFSLEETIGLLSALLGLWIQGEGGRVLYMGQELVIGGLVTVWDTLHATGAIVESRPGKRLGWRTTSRITVDAERQGSHIPIASGESIFLYMEREPVS